MNDVCCCAASLTALPAEKLEALVPVSRAVLLRVCFVLRGSASAIRLSKALFYEFSQSFFLADLFFLVFVKKA